MLPPEFREPSVLKILNCNGGIVIKCSNCRKEVSENESYTYEGKCVCEDCAINAGLFPLGHSGSRRDKISEKGRHLTLPKRDQT